MSRVRDQTVYDARRRDIIAAAAAAFREVGYATATLDMVAERLGVTKAAVYYYYHKKEELLLAICEQAVEAGVGTLREHDPEESVRQQFERFLDAHIREILGNFTVWSVYFHETGIRKGAQAKKIVARQHEIEDRLEALIRHGVEIGEFRQVDPHLVIVGVFGMTNSLYRWYKPLNTSAEELVRGFSDLILSGILPKS